jgi:hypothetical protein
MIPCRVERLLDGRHGVGPHVDKQEDEHANGDGVQECPRRQAQVVQTAHREPDEDREAGDGAEEHGLGGTHC